MQQIKQDEQKAPLSRFGRELPTELWAMVFDFATYIPGELGIAEWTEADDTLELGRRTLCQLTLWTDPLQKQLNFRLGLSLVCRQWQQWMRRLLYRSVIIRTYDHFQRFFKLTSSSSPSGREIAVLVKRLDISYTYGISGDYDVSLSSTLSMLRRILRRCSNLLVLVDPSEDEHPSSGRITGALQGKLDFSKLSIQQLKLPLSDLGAFTLNTTTICSLRHLRALYLSEISVPALSNTTTATSPSIPIPPLSLPQLEILDLSELTLLSSGPSIDEYMTKSYLPRLHSVITSIGYSDPLQLKRFWEKFGPQLRTLGVLDWQGSEGEVYDSLLSIVSSFQNLEQLVVPARMTNTISSEFAKIPSIRRLEIRWEYAPRISILRPDSTILFPNLQSLYITKIPGGIEGVEGGEGFGSSMFSMYDVMRLNDLICYLDSYESSIRTHGISIGLMLADGRELESTTQLKKMYLQGEMKLD